MNRYLLVDGERLLNLIHDHIPCQNRPPTERN